MPKKRIVVALGRNAFGKTLPEQKTAVKEAAKAIADLAELKYQIVITHSNGPQVGMIHMAMTEFGNAHQDFTVAPMLSKDMAKIDWQSKNAKEIKNLVRGLNPIMGAYSLFDGKKIKFWKVRALDEDDVELGKVLGNMDFSDKEAGDVLLADSKKGLFIKTVQGVISVEEIQGENAKRMNVGDFLRGFSIEDGCFC